MSSHVFSNASIGIEGLASSQREYPDLEWPSFSATSACDVDQKIHEKGMAKKLMSHRSGMTYSSLNGKLKGYRRFGLKDLPTIAEAIGVTPAEFLPSEFHTAPALAAGRGRAGRPVMLVRGFALTCTGAAHAVAAEPTAHADGDAVIGCNRMNRHSAGKRKSQTKKPGIVAVPGLPVGPAGFEPATPCLFEGSLRRFP